MALCGDDDGCGCFDGDFSRKAGESVKSSVAVSVVIVHGWDASPDSNWFEWLKKNLEEEGLHCVVPAMPNSALPQLDEWVNHLDKVVRKLPRKEKLILIGHSLGCVTIAHYLARIADAHADGCVFVAGFSGNIRIHAIKEFYETALDLKRVKSKIGKAVSILSLDDKAVPAEKSREFARELGAEVIEVNGYGHFMGSEGVTLLPMILPEIQKLL